jgi:hypothetical protein
MVGLLVRRHHRTGPKTKAPASAADRGLVLELFQGLVGAVLPDNDDYYDASLLNRLTSHAATVSHEISVDKVITRAVG